MNGMKVVLTDLCNNYKFQLTSLGSSLVTALSVIAYKLATVGMHKPRLVLIVIHTID